VLTISSFIHLHAFLFQHKYQITNKCYSVICGCADMIYYVRVYSRSFFLKFHLSKRTNSDHKREHIRYNRKETKPFKYFPADRNKWTGSNSSKQNELYVNNNFFLVLFAHLLHTPINQQKTDPDKCWHTILFFELSILKLAMYKNIMVEIVCKAVQYI
jgi:hypothetical protein